MYIDSQKHKLGIDALEDKVVALTVGIIFLSVIVIVLIITLIYNYFNNKRK